MGWMSSPSALPDQLPGVCRSLQFQGAGSAEVRQGSIRRRAQPSHLAKLLKSGGNVLLLDEPTNDLDVETLRALEEALLAFAGCAVIISHDRWFLDRIATHILAFEGDSQVVWFEGNYADYETDRKRRLGVDGRPATPDQIPEAGVNLSRVIGAN
jgi:ATPase subunit of ABC transporter with duplicated ATPase domains